METHRTSTRRITGLQPTGHLQLGNLLAAVRPMVAGQHDVHTLAFIADQHATPSPSITIRPAWPV